MGLAGWDERRRGNRSDPNLGPLAGLCSLCDEFGWRNSELRDRGIPAVRVCDSRHLVNFQDRNPGGRGAGV